MAYTIPANPGLIRNSIEHQNKNSKGGLSTKEWNDIINVLKEQGNANTKYLESLHRSLWGDIEVTIAAPLVHIATASGGRGGGGAPPPPPPPGPAFPDIYGASSRSMDVGASFEILAGVTADDPQDGDLTSSIITTGTVNTEVAGTYYLTYSVTDSDEHTTTVNRTISIREPYVTPDAPPPGENTWLEPIIDLEIDLGDLGL